MGKKKKSGDKGKKGGKKGKKKNESVKSRPSTAQEEIEYVPEVVETRETKEFTGTTAFRSFTLKDQDIAKVAKQFGNLLTRPISPATNPKQYEELESGVEKLPGEGAMVDENGQQVENTSDTGEGSRAEDHKDVLNAEEGMQDEEQIEVKSAEEIERERFKEVIQKKSMISHSGVKRWSKRKQFKAEVTELFGGDARSAAGFKTFTLDKKVVKNVKWYEPGEETI